jgi:NADH-quinone oxidoreductase subunit C/D
MLLAEALQKEFSATPFTAACDDCLDFSLPTANLKPCLRYLRDDWRSPYRCLWDLTAMDERPSGEKNNGRKR